MAKSLWKRLFPREVPQRREVVAVSFVADGICLAHVRIDEAGASNLDHCGFYPCHGEGSEQTLKEWVDAAGLAGCACRIILDPGDYRVLTIDHPDVPAEEMRDALRWRVQDMLDIPSEELVIEFFPMHARQPPGRGGMIAIAACRKSVLQVYSELCTRVGLLPEVIDIPELAIRNLASKCPASQKGAGLLYLEENRGLIQLQRETRVYVTRRVDFGYRELETDVKGGSEEGGGLLERLVREIQRSFDYYESYYDMPPVAALMVAPCENGGESLVDGLQGVLGVSSFIMQICGLVACRERFDNATLHRCLPAIGGALRGEVEMEQEINFYHSEIYQTKSELSADRLAWACLGVLVAFMLASAVELALNQHLISRIATAREQTTHLVERVTQVRLMHPDFKPDPSLESEIENLERRVANWNRFLQTAGGRDWGSREGFAGYFEGLANRTQPSVWLTGIRIEDGGNEVALAGCALEKGAGLSELVQSLGLEKTFRAKTFSYFRIKQPVQAQCQTEFVLSTHPLEAEKRERH